jgi:hypothetical protein
MSVEAFELTEPELTPEDPLDLNDLRSGPDTVAERSVSEREGVGEAILGRARTRETMPPAEIANLFVFGFSGHGKHLNGGDLLWDGSYTTTYE